MGCAEILRGNWAQRADDPKSLQPEQPLQVLDRRNRFAPPHQPLEVAHREQRRGVIDDLLKPLGSVRKLTHLVSEVQVVAHRRELCLRRRTLSRRPSPEGRPCPRAGGILLGVRVSD
jgi:hypothetical protein